MILGSSAIVAVLRREHAFPRLEEAMEGVATLAVGAPTLFETGMVLTGRIGGDGRAMVAKFLADWGVEIVPFGEAHWQAAFAAFVRFGKGRHPASLNYGDCMTYATARLAGLPLLCTGNDFSRTDLEIA